MTATSTDSNAPGVPPFHVHPGHPFEGFELIECAGKAPLLLARCSCGTVLDRADARFAPCPVCQGADPSCMRCGATGRGWTMRRSRGRRGD